MKLKMKERTKRKKKHRNVSERTIGEAFGGILLCSKNSLRLSRLVKKKILFLPIKLINIMFLD